MRIGIDFDNTLACYDKVFTVAARARGLISTLSDLSKLEVRAHVRSLEHGEEKWKALQGEVYGKRMGEAQLMQGADDFLLACKASRVRVVIVSHKTEFGHFDPDRVNLRKAARTWMEGQDFFDPGGFGIADGDIFFEGTRAGKVARIGSLGCSHFIDDLEEVLLAPGFPETVDRILFDPDGQTSDDQSFARHSDWKSIEHALFAA